MRKTTVQKVVDELRAEIRDHEAKIAILQHVLEALKRAEADAAATKAARKMAKKALSGHEARRRVHAEHSEQVS